MRLRAGKQSLKLLVVFSAITVSVTGLVLVGSANIAGATSSTGAVFIDEPPVSYTLPTVTPGIHTSGLYPFSVNNGTDFFTVYFAAPNGAPLAVGQYNASGLPGSPAASLGVIHGDTSLNQTGTFTIYAVSYDGSGNVSSFAAEFVAAEGPNRSMYGEMSYNSNVSMPSLQPPPWLSTTTLGQSLTFPPTRVGDLSDPQAVELTNLGGLPDVVHSVDFQSGDTNDFIGSTDCVRTLQPGQACSIDVFFVPGSLRPLESTLVVNDQSPNQVQIPVSGTSTAGYYLAAADGSVYPYGDAGFYGDMSGNALNSPIIGLTTTPDGYGYWLLGGDGGVFSFGDAPFFGSTGSMTLNRPVVSMTTTPDGGGYWFVASDGGVFSFGDAQFYGSTGGLHLNRPIVGMAATPDGGGYWLVASDGGIFAFGNARFFGSMGGTHLNRPVVGMAATPQGGGYWLVASDGGIFAFGDAPFYGSTGGIPLNRPIVGMSSTWDGHGYWFVASDGGVFAFGDAAFFGSAGGEGIDNAVAMAGTAPPTLQALFGIPALRGHLQTRHHQSSA